MSSAALVGYRKTVRAVSITISLNAPSLTFCLKSYAVEAGLAGQDIFILRVNFRAATETAAQTLNLRGFFELQRKPPPKHLISEVFNPAA